MAVHELYNLYIEKDRPSGGYSDLEVGPFRVTLLDDYNNRVKQMHHPAYRSRRYDSETDNWKVQDFPEVPGRWVVTASAEEIRSEKGFLYKDSRPIDDLCALLTFCTGRRVTTKPHL